VVAVTTDENTSTRKTAERDRLVLQHLSLAKTIAGYIHKHILVNIDFNDLVEAGVLGLLDAASKYDSEKQVAFPTYAKFRIRGAILDSLRDSDWVSRDIRRRHKEVEVVVRELSSTLLRTPTDDEVAQKLGVGIECWHLMKNDLSRVGCRASSSRQSDYETRPVRDVPCKVDTHPDNMFAHVQMRSCLGTAINTLPRRSQKVIRLYYAKQMTLKEIGVVLGVKQSRVCQIHKSALEQMHVALQSNGIPSSYAF